MTLLRFKRLTLLALCCAAATGCATTTPRNGELSINAQYQQGLEHIEAQRLVKASATVNSMQIRFPFSEYTHRLQLELAKAYVDAGELERATVMVNQFIAMYPRHPFIDYAFYVKGLSNYARGLNALDVEHRHDPYEARTDLARTSFKDLSLMVQRFPESPYVDDAREKLISLKEHLAGHEIRLALASIDEGDTTSARHRANYVIDHYPDTGARKKAEQILDQLERGFIAPSAQASPADAQGDTPPPLDLRTSPATRNDPATPPATTIAIPEHAAFLREDWIMRQMPGRYTIQVTTTNRPNWLNEFLAWLYEFLDKNQLQGDVAYYQHTVEDEQVYGVIYGNYNNLRTAQSAKAKLIQTLGIEDLWVRRFREIQDTIGNDTARLN